MFGNALKIALLAAATAHLAFAVSQHDLIARLKSDRDSGAEASKVTRTRIAERLARDLDGERVSLEALTVNGFGGRSSLPGVRLHQLGGLPTRFGFYNETVRGGVLLPLKQWTIVFLTGDLPTEEIRVVAIFPPIVDVRRGQRVAIRGEIIGAEIMSGGVFRVSLLVNEVKAQTPSLAPPAGTQVRP